MSLCLNPDCLYNNDPTDKFCQKCRFQLLIKDRYRAIKLIGKDHHCITTHQLKQLPKLGRNAYSYT